MPFFNDLLKQSSELVIFATFVSLSAIIAVQVVADHDIVLASGVETNQFSWVLAGTVDRLGQKKTGVVLHFVKMVKILLNTDR